MGYKKSLISIIKFLGINLNEVVVDIPLEEITFNSIEWVKPNKIILHQIIDDLDMEYDFDDFEESVKMEIYIFFVRNYL